jgi:type VI protein secretion system component VasK
VKALFALIPPWVYVVVAILFIVAVVVILVILTRRRRAQVPRVPDGVEDMPAKVHAVFESARTALHARTSDRLANMVVGPGQPSPGTGKRFVVLGPAGAGKTALLSQLARDATFAPAAAAAPGSPCNLFRLDGALAVEIAGRVLRDEDGKGRGGEAFQAVAEEMWPRR